MFKALDFGNKDIERQLTLIFLAGLFLLLGPFSIYRLLAGDTLQFAVDFIMAGIAVIGFIQTWRRKKSKSLNFLSVFSLLSLVSVLIYFKGIDMMYWVFPAMIGSYFLLASTPALIMNALFVATNTLSLAVFNQLTFQQVTGIYPSLTLVCIFGYVLSKRSEFQNEKLSKLVSEDTLTGVGNRRSFDEKVGAILLDQARVKTPVSMLLLDIDFFKKINDSYGHKQGDLVLTELAQKVKSLIRTTDYLYRFGGEEFVVIARNSSLKDSGMLADTIREFIAQGKSWSNCKVTVSIGVADLIENDDADSWFRRADQALYEAKETGRNRVCLAKCKEDGTVVCDQFDGIKNSILHTGKEMSRATDKAKKPKETNRGSNRNSNSSSNRDSNKDSNNQSSNSTQTSSNFNHNESLGANPK